MGVEVLYQVVEPEAFEVDARSISDAALTSIAVSLKRMADRAGAAASAERIKELEARVAELEAEFDEGPICQPSVSKADAPQTSDRAALEALILAVERDGHDGSHLQDDDGQNECPVCATVAGIRTLLKEPDQC